MRTTSKTRQLIKPSGKVRRAKRKSLGQLNRWMKVNYDHLLDKAKQNSLALTAKAIFRT